MFSHQFLLKVKNLIFFKLNIADDENLAILQNLYLIDIAAAIANQIADMRSEQGFIDGFILACQNLFSDGIGFAAIGIEIRGIWLVHQICYILVVCFEPLQQRFLRCLPPILVSRRLVMDIYYCRPRFRPHISQQVCGKLHKQCLWV